MVDFVRKATKKSLLTMLRKADKITPRLLARMFEAVLFKDEFTTYGGNVPHSHSTYLPLVAGAGSPLTDDLHINSDKLLLYDSKTPSAANDTGTTGTVCWDSGYIYVCVATDTWKRAAISTW